MPLDAPKRPSDAALNPVQTDDTAARAASDALPSTPSDATLPAKDASEVSNASEETNRSSNCDSQLPEEAPVIAAPDLAAVLAAQNITDVLVADLNAPLVTVSLEEKALALAPLLRVPYFERLLEAETARHLNAFRMPFGPRSYRPMRISLHFSLSLRREMGSPCCRAELCCGLDGVERCSSTSLLCAFNGLLLRQVVEGITSGTLAGRGRCGSGPLGS